MRRQTNEFQRHVGWAYSPTDGSPIGANGGRVRPPYGNLTPSPLHPFTPSFPGPLTPSSRRPGFTLIEILVVISIILILIGLFFAGSKAVINSGQRNLTLTRLAALNSMLSELQGTGQNQFSQFWFSQPNATANLYAIELDASQLGSVTNEPQAPVTTASYTINPTNMPPPKSFPPSGFYFSNRALALGYMAYSGVSGAAPTAPSPALPLIPSNSNSTNPIKVASANPAIMGPMYLLVALPNNSKEMAALGPNATIPVPASLMTTAGLTNYLPPGANGVGLVVDGWGNPILLCPGSVTPPTGVDWGNGVGKPVGGLANVCTNLQPVAGASNTYSATVQTITSPDGRPFFVSAGPDGDFAKGDDNLYSFEQK